MKKQTIHWIRTVTLLALLVISTKANAQVGNFNITVQNVVQTAPNKLEFDVYLLDTDPGQSFELASSQLGFLFNSSIYSGGSVSVTINNSGSGLNSSQTFSAIPNSATTIGSQTVIKLAGRTPPGAGNGTIISTSGLGTLVTHFIITSTVSFAANSTADIIFTSSSATPPSYATSVSAYISNVNTALVVTPGSNALVNGNPVLNPPLPPPLAYAVTGTGSYCEATSGRQVGLADSESGVDYTLIKNGIPTGTIVAGNGASITFGNQLFGTYTVSGTNSGGTTPMTGSAIISENPLPTVNVGSIPAAICQGGTTTSLGGSFGGSATGAVWSDGGAGGSFANNSGSTPGTTTYTASASAPASVTLTLTTTGGSCGTTPASKVLSVYPSPTVNAGGVMADICQGGTTTGLGGSVGGSATGGTWSTPTGGTFNPSATTLNATWTPPGGYTGTATLTLTTSGGSCGTTFASKTVTVSSGPTVNAGATMADICQGGTTTSLGGSFGGSATGAVWSDGGAGGSFANNSGSTPGTATYTASASAPASLTLTLTTTGGSCGTTSANKVLSVNTSPTVNVGGVMAAICQGGTTTGLGGSVGGSATGGTWSTPAGGTFNPSATILNATWTPPGGYTGTATLTLTTSGGSCGTTFASKTVTVSSGPTVNVGGAMAAICQGGTTTSLGGSFGGSATGAVWSDGGAGGSFANNSGSTPGTATYTASASAPASVTLTLSTTGGSCSTTSASKVLSVNTSPTVNAGGVMAAICQGGTTTGLGGSVGGSATGGTWSTPAGGTFNPSATTLNATWTPTAGYSGTATLTLTTSGGSCGIVSANKSQVVNPLPTVAAIGGGSATVCVGQITSPFTNSTGGGTWTIVPGTGTASITTGGVVTGLTAGTVTVTYTVINTCGPTSVTRPLTINPLPVVAAIGGGSASVCVSSLTPAFTNSTSGGTWSIVPVTGTASISTGGVVTGLTPGVVTVTYTVSNSCGSTAVIHSLTVNPQPTIVATSPACSADIQTYSLGVTVSGGIVTVNNPLATITNIGNVWTISNVPTGANITITVNNGTCQNTLSVTAPNCTCPAVNPPVSGGNKSYCTGGIIPTINATVLTGQTVDWYNVASGGAPLLSGSPSYTPPVEGIYYALARITSTSCVSSTRTPITVTMNPLPTPLLTSSDADNLFCIGTSVTFTAGGGTLYNFRVGGNSVQNGATSTYTTAALTNGQVVDVIVTNANGCIATSAGITNTVSAPPTTSLSSSDADNRFCFGTSVSFTAAGGTSYNFRVTGISVQSGALATYTSSTLNNGETVDVIVTNAAGCSSTSAGITNIVNALPVIILTTPASCSVDLATYSLVVTAISGTVTTSAGTATNTSGNLWSITAVPSGTNITITLTNASGCRSTLNVPAPVCACPVVTAPVSGGDKSYCAGGTIPTINATVLTGETVDWYNATSGGTLLRSASLSYTPTAAGTYYATARNTTTNCVSGLRTAIAVIMNPLPVPTLTSSDDDNIFCSGTSVIFTATGGVSYNFRVAGVSVQNGVTATYTTTALRTGQVVDVIVTGANGCLATSAAITNSVNSTPTGNGGSGGNECDLDFIFKAVPSFGIGTWTLTSGPGTAVFANATTPNATVTVSAYGTYIFKWTEVSGTCSASSTVTVNFYKQPLAVPGTGGNNCGLEFYFSATLDEGIGTWTKVSGPGNVTFSPDPNSPIAAVAVTQFGTYTFRWTVVVNGVCSSSATVVVNFIQQTPANAGSGGTQCDKDFVLNASAPVGTGTWTKVSGPGNAVFSPDNHQRNATVTVDQFGTYRFAWSVVNVTCSSSDVVDVIFRDLPSLNAGIDSELCKGNSIQLNATGTGSFAWTPADLLNNPAIKNPVATPVVSTTFNVVLTDQFGCKNSDQILIDVREKPVADAGADQLLEYVFETTMDAQPVSAWETGVWSVISGGGEFADQNSAKSSVTSVSVGINEYAWTVSNRVCPVSSDNVTIEVKDFLVPTLITPNMDGINDYFVLRGLKTLGKTELTVFDRRGAQVYRNSDYDNSWNGVDYNEKPLTDDTYYYVLKAENGKSVSGYIVIRY